MKMYPRTYAEKGVMRKIAEAGRGANVHTSQILTGRADLSVTEADWLIQLLWEVGSKWRRKNSVHFIHISIKETAK